MSFDRYDTMCGLSQDDFRNCVEIQSIPIAERTFEQMEFLLICMAKMIAAKDRQIADLNKELYDLATKASHK